MMPDLPNMGMERDLDGFKEYFENPLFRSDGEKWKWNEKVDVEVGRTPSKGRLRLSLLLFGLSTPSKHNPPHPPPKK
jgi:hypothetical protein